jgi:Ca2+-binding EF-hand superfamily protein
MDELQQGGIKYSSFLMAALDKKRFLDEEGQYMAFKHMDMVRNRQDNDGFITVSDLKAVFDSTEDDFSDQELTSMIQEFCQNGENRLGFPQFREMMQGSCHSVLDQPSPTAISATMQSRRSSVKQRVSLLSEGYN